MAGSLLSLGFGFTVWGIGILLVPLGVVFFVFAMRSVDQHA